MTKTLNEPIEQSNGHASTPAHLNGAEAKAPPASHNQLGAFRDLARRIYTDGSIQRFEAALHTLLMPVKKTGGDEARVQPPTHSPES